MVSCFFIVEDEVYDGVSSEFLALSTVVGKYISLVLDFEEELPSCMHLGQSGQNGHG